MCGLTTPATQAARDVLAERRRQVEKEGWTPEHDDEHTDGELALAAACYAIHPSLGDHRVSPDGTRDSFRVPNLWPWAPGFWKPQMRRKDLVRAAALILAEIERLDRKSGAKGPVEAAHV